MVRYSTVSVVLPADTQILRTYVDTFKLQIEFTILLLQILKKYDVGTINLVPVLYRYGTVRYNDISFINTVL